MKCISRFVSYKTLEDCKNLGFCMAALITSMKKTMTQLGVPEENLFTKIWNGAGGLIVEVYGE